MWVKYFLLKRILIQRVNQISVINYETIVALGEIFEKIPY